VHECEEEEEKKVYLVLWLIGYKVLPKLDALMDLKN